MGFNDQTLFGRGLDPEVKREIIGTSCPSWFGK